MLHPDLGLRLINDGASRDVAHCYYGLTFSDIQVCGPGLYTVMRTRVYEDGVYAMSFDFGDEILSSLLNGLTEEESKVFMRCVQTCDGPSYLQLPAPVTADFLETRLGEIQHGRDDDFAPFIITKLECAPRQSRFYDTPQYAENTSSTNAASFSGQDVDNSTRPALQSTPIPIWASILRWVVLIPGAIIGSIIVLWFTQFTWWFGSSRFGNDSWAYYIGGELMTNGFSGASWVYIAAYIAPRGKIPVAITFAGAALFLTGVVFFSAIVCNDWMTLIGITAFNVGAVVVSIGATSHEFEL